jgi:hypothetical protein
MRYVNSPGQCPLCDEPIGMIEEGQNAAALLPSHMRDVHDIRPEPQDGSAPHPGPHPPKGDSNP